MKAIAPIDSTQQIEVVAATARYRALASDLFGHQFVEIPVRFDLKGLSSGMFRVSRDDQEIRYNPWIFAKYYADCLASTVPHEVAHYVVHQTHGLSNVRPHGVEWKAVMNAFGADASVRSNYNLDGIPLRQMTRFSYECRCDSHKLGRRRHQNIRSGRYSYRCRRCGDTLVEVRS
jgi:SprT protein